MNSALTLLRKYLPWLALIAGLASIAATLIAPRNPGAFNVQGFARLPVLEGGRLKPLDTVARSSLLQLQNRQLVYLGDEAARAAAAKDPDGATLFERMEGKTPSEMSPKTLQPIEWLLDVFYRPELAQYYRTFVVDNPDLLSLIGQNDESMARHYSSSAAQALAVVGFMESHWRRVSYHDIEPYLQKIEDQAKLALPVDSRLRSPFQGAVIQLYQNLILYQRLENAVQVPGSEDFLSELQQFELALPQGVTAVRAKEAKQPHDETAAQNMMKMGERYLRLADATSLLIVPPAEGAGSLIGWQTAGQSILSSFQTGRVAVSELAYAALGRTWREQTAEPFNTLVEKFSADLEHAVGQPMGKVHAEVRFNAAEPFYAGISIYVYAVLIAILSWFWLGWAPSFQQSAARLVALAWLLTTAGLVARMYLEGRPPVTNLYSSALYIGWAAVGLCLILEAVYRNAIGSATGGIIGFGTLIIAHHLALSGDTMEMMRAVLDSNFWLATHVVAVTTGYAATFLAGFLAIIYVIRGVLTPSLDRDSADALTRMVYGVVCFATLFSFVGTVLGGIWADQSWGRFWGWDPKENGALIIVLWNALILHARWGGIVKQRGLMCLAIFGNVVTGWSWFGVNMLGIGLHSYGFTAAAFWSLSIFVATQLALIGIGLIPRHRWRSAI
jgi:ABC-type transport system involved in cytochrome c biogenesis permease subunit